MLAPTVAGFAEIAADQACALVFALQTSIFGGQLFPFMRLAWTGADPAANGTWAALDDDAVATTALNARLEAIAALRANHVDEARLLVRFECEQEEARMAPAEVAWSGYDGESLLIYLPELQLEAANPNPAWALGANMTGTSAACTVAADGSTWDAALAALRRQSLGNVAPLAEPLTVRRRSVRQRRLCGWLNETPPLAMLETTPPGRLDIDVENGLFALSANEALRAYPLGSEGAPVPPSITVVYQDGYTDHTGARPAPRGTLDRCTPGHAHAHRFGQWAPAPQCACKLVWATALSHPSRGVGSNCC